MGSEKDKKKKRYRRLKFPQTRRDRLKGSNERDPRFTQGISRLSSIHSGLDDGRGRFSSITGRSMDNVSLSVPSMGQMPRPQYANYSMDTDIPLALIDESWSEWGRRGPPMPPPEMRGEDMPDSNGRAHPAMSPTGGSRVMFNFPEDVDDTCSARPKRLSSEADSLAFADDIRDAGGRAMPLQPIHEYDPSNISSLIMFGPEIATKWDFLFPIISILGYLADTGSDIWLAYKYHSVGHYLWFTLTLLFILLPSIAMTIFSLILWVRNSTIVKDPVQRWQWACRILSLLFMMSPLTRLADVIYYAYQSRNSKRDWYHRRKFYERMLDEDTDCNLVRLFETFLENAPQLVLQLYVMTQLGTDEGVYLVVVQCFGLVTSWLTMTWSLVAFHTALRASLPDKARLTNWGKFGMFVWRLFMIASRVAALALFASYFRWYVLVFAGVHFLVMFLWMTKQQTVYCMFKVLNEQGKVEVHHSEILEFFFRVMAAFVHIFCFLNLVEGPSRLRCVAYYSLMYAENVILVMLWYVAASTLSSSWFHMPALLLVMLGFWAGVASQITYYMCCHPNRYHAAKSDKLIRTCVPCAELSLFQDLHYYEDSSLDEEIESLRVAGPRGHSSTHNASVSRSRTLLSDDPTTSIQWDPPSHMSHASMPGSAQYPSQGLTPRPLDGSSYGPGYGPQQGPRGRRISEILPAQAPYQEPKQVSPHRSSAGHVEEPRTHQSLKDPGGVTPTQSLPEPGDMHPSQSPSSPGQLSSDIPSPAAQSSPDHHPPLQRPQTLPLAQSNSPTRPGRNTGTSNWKRNPTPPREPPILQCKTTLV